MNPSPQSRFIPPALAASLILGFALAAPAPTAPAAPVTSGVAAPVAADVAAALFAPDAYPRIDGSTVTQPLGVAFQRAFTGVDVASDQVVFANTDPAYHNLVDGLADLILVTGPSADELAYAASKGVELEVVPVATAAFVFLANSANPVTSLTLDQIRGIYSGHLQYWDEVGGTTDEITAYQRPANSSAQTALLDLVMKGLPLMNPPQISRLINMSDVVDAVGFDRSALGYGYYYYVTRMYGDLAEGVANPSIKLLEVDGVAPMPETMRTGQYPLTTNYYVVFNKAAAPDSPTRRLVDAMLSDQGQQAAQAAGYVPLRDVGTNPPPPDDPAGLKSLDETYTLNPLTATVTQQIVDADGCTQVDRLAISGLRDLTVQDRINATFEQRQDLGLAQLSAAGPVGSAPPTGVACSPGDGDFGWDWFSVDATVSASFSNVLSLTSRSHQHGFDNNLATLNVRLDTGEDLKLADLFTQDADLETFLLQAWAAADPAGDEESFLTAWRAETNPQFFFTVTDVTVYVAGAGYTIPFADHWPQVAIFKRFAAPGDLYTAPAQVAPCPVLTYQSDPWTVDGVSRVCLPRPADEPPVSLTVPDQDNALSSPARSVISVPESGGVYRVQVTSATPWATSWNSTPQTCPGVTWAIDGQPARPLLIGRPGTTDVTITVDASVSAKTRSCPMVFVSQANQAARLDLDQAASSQAVRIMALLQPVIALLKAWLAQMVAIFGLPH